MRLLTPLFNRFRMVDVPREKLAYMVEPLMADSAGEPPTMQDISEAWREAHTWLGIGFEFEKKDEKGLLYWALQKTIGVLSTAMADASPDARVVAVRKIDLEVLGATSIQLLEAARCLEEIYPGMRSGPALVQVPTDDGKVQLFQDLTNTMPIWTRPYADHKEMGQHLRTVHEHIDECMAETGIRPASEWKIFKYTAPRP